MQTEMLYIKLVKDPSPYLIIFLRVSYLMVADICLVSGKFCELNSPAMQRIVNYSDDQ